MLVSDRAGQPCITIDGAAGPCVCECASSSAPCACVRVIRERGQCASAPDCSLQPVGHMAGTLFLHHRLHRLDEGLAPTAKRLDPRCTTQRGGTSSNTETILEIDYQPSDSEGAGCNQ
jgi:hypothetical protein